jgi:hypothetical protein
MGRSSDSNGRSQGTGESPASPEVRSFPEVVPLREAEDSNIYLARWFEPTQDGFRLAIRLDRHEVPSSVAGAEASISLQPNEVINLLFRLVEGMAVAGQVTASQYFVLASNTDLARDVRPEALAEAVARVLADRAVVERLPVDEVGDESVAVLGSAFRLRTLRSALGQLRQHLEGGQADERIYQDWAEQHSWVFGSAWRGLDPVRTIAVGDTVDGLLPTTATGLRDILELKRPVDDPLQWDNSHRNFYWSAAASRAIGQSHRYLDQLHQLGPRPGGLRDHPEIIAYHPRALIIMGRSRDWEEAKFLALHGLNSRMHGITVMTYDQLVWQGERALDVLDPSDDPQ